jgi:two-component system nitrogen regulation sensor histidine kinase NtrY
MTPFLWSISMIQNLTALFHNLQRYNRIFFNVFLMFTICAGASTYYMVVSADDRLRQKWLAWILNADILCIVVFIVLIAFRALELWGKRKKVSKQVYRKHILIVTTVLTIPSLLVFLFNITFVQQGIQAWFGDPVKISLQISQNVAQTYIDENFHTLATASDAITNRMRDYDFFQNKTGSELARLLQQSLEVENKMFAFSEATIINQHMEKIAWVGQLSHDASMPAVCAMDVYDVFAGKTQKSLRIKDSLYVISPIGAFDNMFLMLVVCKHLDPKIVKNIDHALNAVQSFTGLDMQKEHSKITLNWLMALLTLLVILVSISFGFMLVEWLMKPISDLISTAVKIKQGDWNIRAQLPTGRTELSALPKTFNMMLDHIYQQHESIRHEKDLTDMIIAHISQGVVLINQDGSVAHTNTRARTILNVEAEPGMPLQDLSMELYTTFQRYGQSGTQGVDTYISNTQGFRRLQVYIGVLKHAPVQCVIVFDDVTDLLAAQKQESWRDIAKRIAHEIKNPLTPIQLSTESLRRKIMKEFPKQQQDMFLDYLDVVSRQVQTIATLVRELTSFSQTTIMTMRAINLVELCRQVVTFYQTSHDDFQFNFYTADSSYIIQGEDTQVQQVLNNLMTNAVLILNESNQNDKVVNVELTSDDHTIWLEVRDNGPGFDKEIMHKLAEPYVTKRKGGTGVGLAVVAKILHDHGASLRFANAQEGGAIVKIGFKRGEGHISH